MKRADALAACRVAGYHNDQIGFVRLYAENRISIQVARAEFDAGARMRRNGVPCSCYACKKAAEGLAP